MRAWLGRQDSNLRMPIPKTGALPLGDAPKHLRATGPIAALWPKAIPSIDDFDPMMGIGRCTALNRDQLLF
jgi:hypothetical protein